MNELQRNLDYKCKHLFENSEPITLKLPENFKVLEKDYFELRRKNNSTDLPNKQEAAKESLRLHYVKKKLEVFLYDRYIGIFLYLCIQNDKRVSDFD